MSEPNAIYRTVVISDVHLGIKDSKVKELTEFLKQHPCKKLILNGDIIDGWRLQKNGRWRRRHTRFIKYLIKISSKTKIIYIRGNHDDFLDQMVPIGFGNFRVVNSYSMKSGNKKYYIVHGDAFDNITRWVVWVSKFGASSYDILLTINRLYNNYRRRRGLGYKSISKGLKSNVKIVTSLISNFEGKAVLLAKNMGYDGIICGHIHTTADKMIDGIHYLNSGDWVETMSALVEDFEGKWHVRHFQDLGAAEDSGEIPVAAALEAPTEEHPGILSGKPEIGKIITTQVNRRKLLRARDDQRELIKG
jgi:UDP-2,3-diacylglucosamine pyrophosphatase LpxH